MTLKTDILILTEADPDITDLALLDVLKQITSVQPRMISKDMLVSLLTEYDSITRLQESQDEKAKGLYLAIVSGVDEFNVMNTHPVGQAQAQLLSYLVGIGAVTPGFQAACLAYANPQVIKYPSVTLQQVKIERGTINVKPVEVVAGFARLETLADCPEHHPRLLYKDEYTEKLHPIGQFLRVSEAGKYSALVPPFYRSGSLFVDDVYGVLG